MFTFPEFVSDTFNVLLAPTVTLPKLRLAGLVLRRADDAAPVPLSGIEMGELEALL
jgi:hypothetical protein